MNNLENKKGFTIIELMTVIGIIAVVSAITIPNLLAALPNLRLKSALNDLQNNIQKSKLLAARTNQTHAIIFSAVGYILIQDSNSNLQFDGGENIIENVNWSRYPSISLDAAANTFPTNALGQNAIGFRSNGLTRDLIGNLAGGSVFLRNTKNTRFELRVSLGGTVQTIQL